ncbi:MAG: pitrilysin family protein [Clostridia bacterium]|nr:pitrilysin family protein [Clostridia bacterium]
MITKTTLPNGVRVVMQRMPDFRSVSMGVWTQAGSVYETAQEAGISHFIEHMLFKGTQKRTAQDIAAEMDALGGNLNAFTSKECTCFYAKVLGEHIGKSADILADLVHAPKLDAEDIEREKGVVCEEILMTEDTPEDLVHELIAAQVYGDTPLAKPILGTESSVRALSADMLRGYMQRRYVSEKTVIAVAGNLEEKATLELLTPLFGVKDAKDAAPMPKSALHKGRALKAVEKDIEQVHICLGLPGFPSDTPEQYALHALNNVLGGSMSSRLFQSIREQRGLAYSVYSYPSAYSDSGYFTLYAGTGEKQAAQVVALMLDELRRLQKEGVSQTELTRAKEQLKASYIMGQESTSARANAIGKAEIRGGKLRTEEESIALIEGVTMAHVQGIIPIVCDLDNLHGAFVGRMTKKEKEIETMILNA